MSHIIDVHQLQVKLQNKAILSDVSFSLNAGEILGLVGPSGCGKTTLLNTLAGFIEQESGHIIIDNAITITKDTQIPPEKRNVGMIFQDYALFPHLTVNKNVGFGIEKVTNQDKQLRIKELLSLLELDGFDDRYPHQLSGGQQQRVAIARALAPQPKVLLLDEPFSNIDARLRNELMIEIRQLLKSLNMTAIFVTHNKDEVFTFADKIAVMYEGRILQVGSPMYVSQNPSSWQVADFLQLGSWLPVITKEHCVQTALGEIETGPELDLTGKSYLLIKPKTVEVDDNGQPNVVVNHLGMTEQGYHYIVNSINENEGLRFKRLSFYHEEVFTLGQKLSICIKPHQLQLF